MKLRFWSNSSFMLCWFAAIYIDEAKGEELWLRALCTCRTEDWHFLKTVLFHFLNNLPNVEARRRRNRSRPPNLLGGRQNSGRFHTGTRWVFTEGRNTLNPASHCDIAWAGALSK